MFNYVPINLEKLNKLIDYILSVNKVQLFELYSEIDSDINKFNNFKEFESYLNTAFKSKKNTLKFVVICEQLGVSYTISEVEASTKYSSGPEYRKLINGNGLIKITIYNKQGALECSIELNTDFEKDQSININALKSFTQKLINLL